jgi:hypothetical protein
MGHKAHNEQPPEEKDEGPRSFAVFLRQIAGGDAEMEASAELQELIRNIRAQAAYNRKAIAGKFTIDLKIACDETGAATIGYEIKTKAPKPKTAPSIFWVTKSGNLTASNPRQMTLGVREVPATPDVPARDVGGEVVAAREA